MYMRVFGSWGRSPKKEKKGAEVNGKKEKEKTKWSDFPANVQDEILTHVTHLPVFSNLVPMASRTVRGRKHWDTVVLPAMLVSKDWWTSVVVMIPRNEPEVLLDYAPESYFRLHLDCHIFSINQCSMPLYARVSMKLNHPLSKTHPVITRKLSSYLIRCLDRNFTSCIATLLLWGANPDSKTEDGYSALYLAVQRRMPAMVDLLISHGPVKIEEVDGRSPLALAAMTYQVTIMYSLLAGGANPYIEFTYGKKTYNLVSWACLCSDWRMVKCLLEQGVDMVKMVKSDAEHPLVVAAVADNLMVVGCLLEEGVRCKGMEGIMFANELACPPRIVTLLTKFELWPQVLSN